MPVITLETVEGLMDASQKKALSRALTDAVTLVLGEKIKPNTWVYIKEAPEGNFHVGGHTITADILKKAID